MKNDAHRDIQERLLNKLFFILSVLAIPTLSFSLSRFFSIGWQPIFLVHIIITIIFLLISVYRKLIPYYIKVTFLIGSFCLLAIVSAINLGMSGLLVAFLMLSVFIGIVFWGRKTALIIYIGGAVSILLLGILTVKGIVSPNIDIENYQQFLSSWITTTIGFTFIAGLSILIVGEIGHILAQKITELKKANFELRNAQDEIRKLSGLLPICSHCKKIRDDRGYWNQIEDYISHHSEAKFSHGICRDCAKEHYPEFNIYED